MDFVKNIEAVILAAGDYPAAPTPLDILCQAQCVVCCDGATDEYIARGNTPDAIVGDGDSLSDDVHTKYPEIIHIDSDQETNDQTKAVKFLHSKGVTRIAIVGATGKREDHTMGNISLLAEYQRRGLDVRIYTDYGVFVACSGTQRMACRKGQAVSIFNISAKNLSSEGLQYPIYDFSQLWQGTLNRTTAEQFVISAEGEYLLFIAYSNQ
ncbi:MAG: thiamine diphosphokinase [Alistipes sp.]|nr:thiamine diphosphokinase [Alistipes sp.]